MFFEVTLLGALFSAVFNRTVIRHVVLVVESHVV